ncbi:MAG: carboxypeptidase-like regulatory domain-containing protein [Planctomycetes bacterium]|nr:carboxypeptidase-like regulatory domain-containing protein [Planctomycetota bacterium]
MQRFLVPLVLAVCAAGCGDAPSLVPVRGTVTLDGKPLVYKNIRFLPEPGTPGIGAGANTDANGTYTLLAVRPGAVQDTPGVPPGAYKVVVGDPLIPIEEPVPEATGPEPAPAIGLSTSRPKKKQVLIPARYTKPETTPLRVDVPSDGGPIDLALTSG